MEKVTSKRDVIVCRGIWYVVTLLSLLGLSISLNLLLPPGDTSGTARSVSQHSTQLRYSDISSSPILPPLATRSLLHLKRGSPQVVFSELAMHILFTSPVYYEMLMKNRLFVLYMSLFTISLFTGGIGLIQLSDKFRMEMRHALFTLFFGWLVGLFGIFEGLYYVYNLGIAYFGVGWFFKTIYLLFSFWIYLYNFPKDEDLGYFRSSFQFVQR